MEVIDELCLTLSKAKTLDRILESVQIWRKEHAEQILKIIHDCHIQREFRVKNTDS